MAVSDEVREVEREIDDGIGILPLWRCGRGRVIRAALDYDRAFSKVLIFRLAQASLVADGQVMHRALPTEDRVRAGVFYTLKWALKLCPEQWDETFDAAAIHSTKELGGHYEALVDA
jgi:hypothetical protein